MIKDNTAPRKHMDVEAKVEEFKQQRGMSHLRSDYPEGFEDDIEWLRTTLTTQATQYEKAWHRESFDRGVELRKAQYEESLREVLQEVYSHFSWCRECSEGPACSEALALAQNRGIDISDKIK